MVYDRGRGVREANDSPRFRSGGSPRSRFAPETSFVQKPALARPNAVQLPDAPIADDSVLNFKPIVGLITERTSCCIQRDATDKRNKKLRDDLRRCQNADFPSAAEFINVSAKAGEFEKAKLSQRIAAIDEKLERAFGALEAAVRSKVLDGNGCHNLTPPPSETSSDINLSIEEKLGQFRDNIEAWVRSQVAESLHSLQREIKDTNESRTATTHQDITKESQKLRHEIGNVYESRIAALKDHLTEEFQELRSEVKEAYESSTAAIQNHAMQESQQLTQMRANLEARIRKQSTEESQKLQSKIHEYEAQIATLKQDLSKEKQFSETLQVEMNNMVARLAAIETKVEDQAKISSQLDRAVKQEAFLDLESRFAKFEAWQMATTKSKNKEATKNKEDASDIRDTDDRLNVKDDTEQPQKSDTITEKSLDVALEQKLENNMTQFLLRSGDKIMPDERVTRLMQPKISAMEMNVQSELHRVAGVFGTWMDKEREIRASFTAQVKAATESANASAQAVEVMRAELAQTAGDRQLGVAALSNQDLRIQDLTAALTSTKAEIESTTCELQKSMDALSVRTANLNAWQQNFSTPQLYEAIVQHLNNSFVSEHVSNLTKLRTRVTSLESQLGDGSNKKRKLPQHGMLPFPPQAT